MTIQRQMLLLIAGPVLLIYIAILGAASVNLYSHSKRTAEESMGRIAASFAAGFEGRLVEVSRIADTTARFLESAPEVPESSLYAQLERNVQQTPLVFGSCLAFEPGVRRPRDVLFAPYVCRDGDGMRHMDIDRSVYDWYSDPSITWFARPKQAGRSVWSEPYFDVGAGNILMSTYSAPFAPNGAFAGVCTIDIDLPRLRETVGRQIDAAADFVILTRDGRFVYDRDSSRIMTKTIFDVATESGRPALANLARRMLAGGSGSAVIDAWDSQEPQWVFFAQIPSADWVFACRVPERIVLSDVRRRMLWAGAALGATLLLMIASVAMLSRSISRPIVRLRDTVAEVGRGNLEARSDEHAPAEEVRALASAFNRMTGDLRAHVQRLAAEMSARKRIERDLDIAREIQQGLLPRSKPTIPGYEVAASSRPADKTGGDYYDWVLQPDGGLFFSIADVSGHGVGPALVTAVCRAYARASLATAHDLDKLLGSLNDLLFADLPELRFVTYAGAVLDPREHNLRILSAGHGPTFHYRPAARQLDELGSDGMPLGLQPDQSFGSPTLLSLDPGGFVLMLTDGVFECLGPDAKRYGLPRLRQTILENAHLDAQAFVDRLVESVAAFAQGAPQEDDITIVLLRRVT